MHCISLAILSRLSQFLSPHSWHKLNFLCWRAVKTPINQSINLQCKHLWPIALSIHALLIQHNHVDFCVLKLYYVMLCCVSFAVTIKARSLKLVCSWMSDYQGRLGAVNLGPCGLKSVINCHIAVVVLTRTKNESHTDVQWITN